MKKLLILVDSPGSAGFIAPVIPFLKKIYKISIVTVNTAAEAPYKLLKEFRPFRCDQEKNAEALYRKLKPDALLAGTSSLVLGPFVTNRFIRFAAADKKPVIAFQDYWANHRWPQNTEVMRFWNAVIVPDELTEKLLREDNFKGAAAVTGNPAFDKFRAMDVSAARAKLRKKLNIREEEFVILYAGTGTPQAWQEDEITFQFLANTLQEFFVGNPDTILIPRAHPRDEEKNRYHRLAPRLPIYNPDYKKTAYSTDDLLPMADCVISMYSTALLHACFLKIPAISILLPEAGRARLRKIHLDNFPPNTVGASVGIYKDSTKELLSVLDEIRHNPNFREKIKRAQTQFFSFPEHKKPAAEEAADAINRLISQEPLH